MHFALPPKKATGQDTMFKPRSSTRLLSLRRSRLKHVIIWIIAICGFLMALWKVTGLLVSDGIGTPPVVIVTVMKPEGHTQRYMDTIKENREQYAKKHGYATFFPTHNDYNVSSAPKAWAKLPAMRHAMKLYPKASYYWFLDQDTLIMNPAVKIETDIMHPRKLDQIMLKGQPIVPPGSIITTFAHLRGEQIHFVLTQDNEGLSAASWIVRNDDWAKFMIDTWFDPLYRTYNFAKGEVHALEHIVQWHPTILARLAVIPQNLMNSYSRAGPSNTVYKEGDFVVNFFGCDGEGAPKCEAEASLYFARWRTVFKAHK